MSIIMAPGRELDAVVIGTSAGGVEALTVLLPQLPAGFGAPVFIVLHLPRDRPSLLARIFAPRCQVAVVEAEDKQPVEPATVYFAPPDYHMLIDIGPHLALSSDEPVHHSRPSIDVLFESAAEAYGSRLAGIILTGGSADGAAGLEAIRRVGGLTIVQQPEEAYASLMVESALNGGPVDHVLRLREIAALFATPEAGPGAAAPGSAPA
ncbi:MAG: chemotaxis protein CheB [Vicinamibacterales bacterium]